MIERPLRSALYTPGSNRRALEKTRALDADVVIYDLEDAVAPQAKENARRQAVEAIASARPGNSMICVRVNALDAAWFAADIAAVAPAEPDAILVPKIEGPDDVARAASALDAAGAAKELQLWAMIETPRAVLGIAEIARMADRRGNRLTAFVVGVNDLARMTRARLAPERTAVLPWLSLTVLAARAYGLSILDGAYPRLADPEGLRAECVQGRDLGMDGKTLIHPEQIAIANESFTPSAEEIEEARRLVAAFERPENAGRGVIDFEGRMAERLHADMARATLALADRLARRAP